MSRHLPPYGRELAARLQGDPSKWWGAVANGKSVTLFLLCGADAWRTARQWQPHRLLTLAPPGEDPLSYDWRDLAGHDPVLLWRCGRIEGDEVVALLRAVMRDGVQRIYDVATQQSYIARRSAA